MPGAFGLGIESDAEIPGLAVPGAVAGARRVEHRLVGREAIEERCGEGALTPLGGDGEGADRRSYFEHASGGELMRTQSYGEHLIADRGGTVLSAVEGIRTELWQRFLLGQVLPATASIQGLEVFHASAVSTGDGVIALAGPAGAGKSTLAAALLGAGATFYVDDVLAVDAGASGTRAYPGPGLMALAPARARELGLDGKTWISGAAKSVVELEGDRRARPIRAFLCLRRDEQLSAPRFAPCPPHRLMAMTFDALPRSPERLRRLLRVCAELASTARALELCFSSRSDPREVASAIIARLAGEPVAP